MADIHICIHIMFYIMSTIYIFLWVLFYIITPKLNNSVLLYSDDLINQFTKKPITEIIISDYSYCPSGYTSLTLGKFPFVSETCVNSVKRDSILFPSTSAEEFSDFSRSKGCVTDEYGYSYGEYLGFSNYFAITYYRNSLLCIKTLESYFLNYIIDADSSCPSDYKECYGKIDTAGKKICVSKNTNCPINYLVVANMNEYSIPPSLSSYLTTKVFNDNSGYALISGYIPNKIGEFDFDYKIVTDIGVSEGYPCALPYEHSKPFTEASPLFDDYELYNRCTTFYESINYNPNITPIDSQYGISVMENNSQLGNYMSIPYFPASSTLKNDYILWYRNYPSLSNTCLSEFSTKLAKYTTKLKEAEYSKYENPYFSGKYGSPSDRGREIYVISIVLISFSSYAFLQQLCSNDDNVIFYMFSMFNILVLLGVLATNIALTVIAFKGKSSVYKYGLGLDIYNSMDSECFDSYSYWSFKMINEHIADQASKFSLIGGLSIIGLVMFFPYAIISMFYFSSVE